MSLELGLEGVMGGPYLQIHNKEQIWEDNSTLQDRRESKENPKHPLQGTGRAKMVFIIS